MPVITLAQALDSRGVFVLRLEAVAAALRLRFGMVTRAVAIKNKLILEELPPAGASCASGMMQVIDPVSLLPSVEREVGIAFAVEALEPLHLFGLRE